MDDLNALIAHAHRRIDQLNTELAEQRVREQIHIEAALQQQKGEHQRALEKAVGTALQHAKEESRLEQEGKVSGVELGLLALARQFSRAIWRGFTFCMIGSEGGSRHSVENAKNDI